MGQLASKMMMRLISILSIELYLLNQPCWQRVFSNASL